MPGLGNITQDGYTVWCGKCDKFSSMNSAVNISDCARVARKFGWKKIKGLWHCPDCAKQKKVKFELADIEPGEFDCLDKNSK